MAENDPQAVMLDFRVIEDRIALIKQERAVKRARKSELEANMQAVDQDLFVLAAKMEALESLRPRVVGAECHIDAVSASADAELRVRPREAVLAYLDRQPHGALPPDIADALQDKIRSKAKDRRKVLLTTIYHLRDSGVIQEGSLGTVRKKESGNGLSK